MSQMTDELAIHKSIVVSCSVDDAFRVFTEGIGRWWPFEGHSLFEENTSGVVFDGEVGGRVYEVSKTGEEGLWGTLTAWEPPHRLAMTWHPGRGAETAQDLEVRFSTEAGGTRVDLKHTGWHRLGDRAAEIGGHYVEGWDFVLGRYAEATGKEA